MKIFIVDLSVKYKKIKTKNVLPEVDLILHIIIF